MNYTATYSPEDNKLRLYSLWRLPREEYARVKKAGFRWAPKQDLFVAPAWSPEREDLLLELCGEIGDEDTSLVDRAEQRADRFEDYSDKRKQDADHAHAAVMEITDNIPLGQPILIGHHSEKRARKMAEKVHNGMRKAVNMWETSKYWTSRAAGALHHAKYKELPGVRARRIKGLETDKRRQVKNLAEAETLLKAWQAEGLTLERAAHIANYNHLTVYFTKDKYPNSTYEGASSLWGGLNDGYIDQHQAVDLSVQHYERWIARSSRWLTHLNNRLEYEKAMLEEQGASDLLKPIARSAQLPLCNYRAPDGITLPDRYTRGRTVHYVQVEMTKDGYARINKDYKGTRDVEGSHRIRSAMIKSSLVCVFLTDSKVHEKPEPVTNAALETTRPAPAPTQPYKRPEPTEFDAMKDQLKQGVQVVVAPQLFTTSDDLADRVVDLADIETGQTVCDPSAGTGQLLRAIRRAGKAVVNTAVEINYGLVEILRRDFDDVRQADFLQCNGDLGTFDRIVMNPPFADYQDIKHILHARTMLNPGGKLVAICANGPRQRAVLKPIAEESGGEWIDLPAGSFKHSGTMVNTAMLVINN